MAQRRTFPRERRGQVRANIHHTFPQCARGEAALPHQAPSGGMEGSVHRSSHMEANTYLIHQGGGIKKAQGPRRNGGGLGFRAGTGPGGRRTKGWGAGARPLAGGRGALRGRGGDPGPFNKPAFPAPRPPPPCAPLARAHLPAPCRRGRG